MTEFFDEKPPLAELMAALEKGWLPSEEVIKLVLESWRQYLESGDLETAFFGPARPKSGNYAARVRQRQRNLDLVLGALYEMDGGLPQLLASEAVADEFERRGLGRPEPETVARLLREFERKYPHI